MSAIYGIEKLNQYLLGNSETSSGDLRLIITAIIQLIVILIISLIVGNTYSEVNNSTLKQNHFFTQLNYQNIKYIL